MHIYHLSMTLVNCCEVEGVSNKEKCYLRILQSSAPKNGPHVTIRTCVDDLGSPVTSGHLLASKPLESSCQTVEKLKATPAFDCDTAISLFMENITVDHFHIFSVIRWGFALPDDLLVQIMLKIGINAAYWTLCWIVRFDFLLTGPTSLKNAIVSSCCSPVLNTQIS